MSKYIVENNRFKKDGKRISKANVEKELSKVQFSKLVKNGKYTTRVGLEETSSATTSEPSVAERYQLVTSEFEYVFKPSELKKIKSVRHLYRVVENFYINKGFKKDLMRKDVRYGFERFCCHLDDTRETTVNRAILLDLEKQKEEANKVYNNLF